MGNSCINFKRKKRLQEEEQDFRRKMEERIQQSSRRLRAIPPDQLSKVTGNGNDLLNIKTADLNRPNCTPLRPNSQGVFVEVDQQYIEEQLNNLKNVDRLNLIESTVHFNNSSLNNEWTNQILNQPNSVYNLSRINQLRLLQSNPSSFRLANHHLNSFDNKSFVNTSIDNNLFDQNLFHNRAATQLMKNGQLNSHHFNQQINQINNQIKAHSSLNSINALVNGSHHTQQQSSHHQFNSNILLNNLDNLAETTQPPVCSNVLDAAANRIFYELTYMENRYPYNGSGCNLNFENDNLCYLPLDRYRKLNCINSSNFNQSLLQIPSNLNAVQSNNLLNVQSQCDQNINLSQQNNFNLQPKLALVDVGETVNNNLRNQKLNDLEPNLGDQVQPSTSGQHLDKVVNSDGKFIKEISLNESHDNCPSEEEANTKDDHQGSPPVERDYLTLNPRKECIEEKDELNDSGNASACDKQISRAESMENNLINSQIEIEPWFFAQINTRSAAEHVLRMKGNRVGAFLVRHAQQLKFTADAPFVLSLKVLDVEKPIVDKSQNDKQHDHLHHHHHHHYLHSNSGGHFANHSASHSTNHNTNETHKATKDILHFKIYSQLACPDCDLKMYYINPSSQFTTIRQLISFYSEGGLAVKLDKPCLPFGVLNCCYSGNKHILNCDICNELISTARTNRWSTGNLSGNSGTQPSQTNSLSSNEIFFQTYIEQNPDSFVRLATPHSKDEKNAKTAQLLSKSLNSIRASSADRISSNGIPVNSTNRILTDIKFEDQINKLNTLNQLNQLNQSTVNRNRFSSSLDDFGLGNSVNLLQVGLSSRLRTSLKERFRNRSLASINYSDGVSHNLTSSGSTLSRKSSDSRKAHVRTGSLIGGHKYRISSTSCSFKENVYDSADNLKRRSSSIRLKPGNSAKYQLMKANSASVSNVSCLKNSSA